MSEEEEEINFIPVNLIKRFHFCPRTVYFEQVLGYKETQVEYMKEGKEKHLIEEEKIKKRKFVFPYNKEEIVKIWTNLRLKSKKLGIYGDVDIVVKTKRRNFIIERKNSFAKKVRSDHLYQAVAYAMLAEENLGILIHNIIIHYLVKDKIFNVKITDEMRDHVIWTIKKIKEIIEKSKLYPYKKKPYCKGCGFYNVCKEI